MGFQEPSSSLRTPSPPSLFQSSLNPRLTHHHSSKNRRRTLMTAFAYPATSVNFGNLIMSYCLVIKGRINLIHSVSFPSCFSAKCPPNLPPYTSFAGIPREDLWPEPWSSPLSNWAITRSTCLPRNFCFPRPPLHATQRVHDQSTYRYRQCSHVNISPIDTTTDRLNGFLCLLR